VSQLADRFVKDPRDVVTAGDVVRVRVKDVDLDRKRIALTMKNVALEGGAPSAGKASAAFRQQGSEGGSRTLGRSSKSPESDSEPVLAAAIRRAQEK
jgi:uncharacterized protein